MLLNIKSSMIILLSLKRRYERSNLLKDRGLLRRSFLTPRNDNQNLEVFGQTLFLDIKITFLGI
jgi:hypothetical protein